MTPIRTIQPPANQQSVNKIQIQQVQAATAIRAMEYGTGGIGKSLLAAMAPSPVVFFDLDNSLGQLKRDLTAHKIPVTGIIPCANWSELRRNLQSSGWEKVNTIVIDTITRAEEMCINHVLATVKTFEKPPQKANSLEDYGYGKDVRIVYENFLPLLGDLERHYVAGRNIILIAHDCKPEETNPDGANYIRFEPRLRTSKKGENSIRMFVKEWCDFVMFLRYDLAKTGTQQDESARSTRKASGSGTRQIYLSERPAYMAKNRGCAGPLDFELGKANPWDSIIQ